MHNYCDPLKQKPATYKGADLVHALESSKHRMNRLGGYTSAQSLCSNGNAHAIETKIHRRVTCPKCQALLVQYPQACEA